MVENFGDNETSLDEKLQRYYKQHDENNRLKTGEGQLEFVRTQQIIQRFLPAPSTKVLDVGGGSGIYGLWLTQLGYEVHLVDVVPRHVEQARTASAAQEDAHLASIQLGDARELGWREETFDVVLLLGPLYHLPDYQDRIQALHEAHRVLKPGGVLLAAAITRFASTLDGLIRGELKKRVYWDIVQGDLTDGHHHNPTGDPRYFTETFFHHPEELENEVREAGFQLEAILGVEGPGWLVQDFDAWWADEEYRARLLTIAERLESEPSMMGIGPHLIAAGRKGLVSNQAPPNSDRLLNL